MKIKTVFKRIGAILISAAVAIGGMAFVPVTVQADNFLYITDITLAAGEGAYESLEDAGYNVMTVGLNAAGSGETQVYVGYRLNEGSPVTNILIARDAGAGFDTEDGIHYELASDTDVDEGLGSTGNVYITRDSRAGEPLVGLYVMIAGEDEQLYPIPNDGAEVVRFRDGTPADLEQQDETATIYLAQIRDGLVKPYISEIAVVSGENRMDAVTIAASYGYNYYAEGDIDESADSYTILAYHRTADEEEAITNITALSSEMAELLEESQIIAGEETETGEEIPEETSFAEEPEENEAEAEEESVQEEAETESEPEEDVETEEDFETEEEIETGEDLETEEDLEAEGNLETEENFETGEDFETEENFETEEDLETEEELETEEVFEGEEEYETEEEPETAEEYETEEEPETEEEFETEEETWTEEESEAEEEPETESEEEESIPEEVPEDEDDLMTAAAVDISGIEYVRISSRPVAGISDYYLYVTKDPEAGNPVAMLYSDDSTDVTETLFGMWCYGFFTSQGVTNAASYVINEDILNEIMNDKSVYIGVPVYLLDLPDNGMNTVKEIVPDETPLTISLLTAKEGLPEDRYVINGMRVPSYDPPLIDRDETQTEESTLPSSVFSRTGYWSIAAGGIALIAAAAGVFLVRKRRRTEDGKKK